MQDSAGCVNVRAEECSVAGVVSGRNAVRFQGDEYSLLGFYFARRPGGRRELFYILRTMQAGPHDGWTPTPTAWTSRLLAASDRDLPVKGLAGSR